MVSVPMLVQGKAGRVWGCSRYKEEALPSSSFRIGSWENLEGVGQLRKHEVNVLPGTAACIDSVKGRQASG